MPGGGSARWKRLGFSVNGNAGSAVERISKEFGTTEIGFLRSSIEQEAVWKIHAHVDVKLRALHTAALDTRNDSAA